MVDLPLTHSPGYIVMVYDDENDDLARYFVVCGAADGGEATALVLGSVPEKMGHAVRNASQSEVEGMKAGEFHAVTAASATRK
ncbi:MULTISPECIES: hypothetical protein [Bradyrhizobium]|uniref:hypothetical protein n=1 Tax=Bradyrhizobium elkanii TaxID=29448 RepID=UPI0003FF2F0A|nr:hypothetical protein [Bradyrhizobium elkanii]